MDILGFIFVCVFFYLFYFIFKNFFLIFFYLVIYLWLYCTIFFRYTMREMELEVWAGTAAMRARCTHLRVHVPADARGYRG
jgi:hypothetical protein